MLSQPAILLVVLLNVSLNTLPALALRVICQAVKKAGPKVRGWGSPQPEPVLGDAGLGVGGRETQAHAQGPRGGPIIGPAPR